MEFNNLIYMLGVFGGIGLGACIVELSYVLSKKTYLNGFIDGLRDFNQMILNSHIKKEKGKK
jgi:hypothetical protein